MSQQYSAFSYKYGNSFIHRLPAWIKLIVIPGLNIIVFCCPFYVALAFLVVQFLISCYLKYTIAEQIRDLKPVLYYAVLLYLFSLVSSAITGINTVEESIKIDTVITILKNSMLSIDSLYMLLKLFCIMQSASIVYRTSTSLEIREGIWVIEKSIRRCFRLKEKQTFTNTVSLFINFIPMIFSVWTQIKKAWIARQGKNGIRMYLKLLPVLFSVGMKKAYNSARALSIRS